MSDRPPSPTEAREGARRKTPRRKMLIVLVGIAVVLGAVGTMGFILWRASEGSKQPALEQAEEAHEQGIDLSERQGGGGQP